MSIRQVSIGRLLAEVKKWNPAKMDCAEPFDYIDLSAVDRHEKAIVSVARTNPREAPSRARQLVRAGDVLVSTVRPNLNGVAAVPGRLDGATASTGFTVLRPRPDKLWERYLFHWVRSPGFVRDMTKKATGASYPAVSDAIVKESGIPLPPLPEQRRIAAILDKADAIRRKRREAVALTEELLRSTFLEMFGDPVTNPKGWPVVKMDTLVRETQYGTSVKANENKVGPPVLRMNNVTVDGRVDLSSLKWVELSEKELPKRVVQRGDLMFNRTNSPELVGKTAVWHMGEGFVLAGYLFRVRFNQEKAVADYVSGFLNSSYGKRYLFVKAKASNNMSNFSAGEFRKIPIPAPPVAEQIRFSAFAAGVRSLRDSLERDSALADNLFHSLVQRAFRGDLSRPA